MIPLTLLRESILTPNINHYDGQQARSNFEKITASFFPLNIFLNNYNYFYEKKLKRIIGVSLFFEDKGYLGYFRSKSSIFFENVVGELQISA